MNFVSPFPDVVIPDTGVYEYVFGDLGEADGDRVALVETATGTELSYRTLVARIQSFACALVQRGIGVGDVVALLSPNSAAFAAALHGILRAGATATPINVLFTVDEIARQLRDSSARLLIAAPRFREQAEEAASAAGLSSRDVLLLDIDAFVNPSGSAGPEVAFDPATHVAVLPFSSGTTGKPKGVMLTHRNLVANVAQLHPVSGVGPDETLIAVVPFFHSYGLTGLLCAAMRDRARLVVMPAFDLAAFLATIQNYRVTQAYIAPPVAVALAKDPIVDSYDLSSLHTLTSAAAPLDEELAKAVTERLGCRVVQAYGMTELSPASHVIPLEGRHPTGVEAPVSSCGWTVPNSVSKIVDIETGDEIPVPSSGLSEPGELCFRGPNVMAGYLGNAAATAEIIDADGFLHTGDLARVDAAGCVYIVDRLKELIKYKGYQVAPAELEALLLTHPGVADVAVVGVIHNVSGEEIPKAFVVRQGSVALSKVRSSTSSRERWLPTKDSSGRVRRQDPEVADGQDPAQGSAWSPTMMMQREFSAAPEGPATAAEVLDRVNALVPVLHSRAVVTEAMRKIHPDNLLDLINAGVFRLPIPADVGGYQADEYTLAEVLAQIARGCPSSSWICAIMLASNVFPALLADEAADEIYATPDLRITAALAPTGQAIPAGGGYRVSGRWLWNSGGIHGNWFIAPCMTPASDVPLMAVVPSAELAYQDNWCAAGMSGTATNIVVATDVFVPAARTIFVKDLAEAHYPERRYSDDPYYNRPWVMYFNALSAPTLLGIARGAMDSFLLTLPERGAIAYTGWSKAAEAPVLHHQLAKAQLALDSAEMFAAGLSRIYCDAGQRPPSLQKRVQTRVWMGHVATLARECVNHLFEASSASETLMAADMQRYFRDINVLHQHAAIQPNTANELYGRFLAGLEPNSKVL